MLSIAAILKNEQPYILEWLAYHLVLGIEDFYIADNISSDGGSELLVLLDKANFITRIEHPTKK
nr:glycosyltransferase family 2 protein [Citrobacter braakii]